MVDSEYKIKLLTKAYLTLNKDRRVSSREVCNWLNGNNFGLNQKHITAKGLTMLMLKHKDDRGILRDVNHNLVNGNFRMWIDGK